MQKHACDYNLHSIDAERNKSCLSVAGARYANAFPRPTMHLLALLKRPTMHPAALLKRLLSDVTCRTLSVQSLPSLSSDSGRISRPQGTCVFVWTALDLTRKQVLPFLVAIRQRFTGNHFTSIETYSRGMSRIKCQRYQDVESTCKMK